MKNPLASCPLIIVLAILAIVPCALFVAVLIAVNAAQKCARLLAGFRNNDQAETSARSRKKK